MNTLKEYYVNLNKMMENAVNMLTAINQSLITSSSSVNASVTDISGVTTNIKIPSFLYLESKLEQLENNFTSLMNIPESGEAWYNNSSEMYKLQLVKSNTSPIVPIVSVPNSISASYTQNNILKDLVNPKTYIRLNVTNIPDNIEKMYMRKIIIYNVSLASRLSLLSTVDDWNELLYSFSKGVDYDEYESELKMPLKSNTYVSAFPIQEIVYPSFTNESSDWPGNIYIIGLSSLKYYNAEDRSIEYTIKEGTLLSLGNTYCVYKVTNIDTLYNSDDTSDVNEYLVTLEEYIGHVILQSYTDNTDMVLQIYDTDYSKYHYIDIPLEENPYIGIFLSTVYNNVRSNYTDAIYLDLNSIYMKDADGNYLTSNGTRLTYMDFYNKYCKNIGDMIQGFTETSYPQLSNYSNAQLSDLVESEVIKQLVTDSLYDDNGLVLNVSRINKHLIDDQDTEDIVKLHEDKMQKISQLSALQNNIDEIYNQLVSTDFSQDVSLSQEALQNQLNNYYAEKHILQNTIIDLVDNINLKSNNTSNTESAKFRIRGVTNAYDKYDNSSESQIISYLHSTYVNLELIGMEVEYKYKSINSSTTNAVVNTNSVFTDWNRIVNEDKQRYLKFDTSKSYNLEFINYNPLNNIVKWNQIDIPITPQEDVIIRIRYKYSVGQPFINLYTPWSDEVTVSFPTELLEDSNLETILTQNYEDTQKARFNRTLINDGYFDHINNKSIYNDNVFYHQPENIYSGFNTDENNALSLKQYLTKLTNEVDEYKKLLKEQIDSIYKVYIEYDNNTLELTPGIKERININASNEETLDTYTKKYFKIIIRNEGSSPINLYSLFPGDSNIRLIDYNYVDGDYSTYERMIGSYERVPLLYEDVTNKYDSIYYQTFGQWVYFRQNNIYTKADYYLNESEQKDMDDFIYNKELTSETSSWYNFGSSLFDYLCEDNKQALLPFKPHYTSVNSIVYALNKWGILSLKNGTIVANISKSDTTTVNDSNVKEYEFWKETTDHKYAYIQMNEKIKEYNNFALKYEHLYAATEFDENSNISTVDYDSMFESGVLGTHTLAGAFLIPEIQSQSQILCSKDKINVDQQAYKLNVGKSVVIPILYEYFLDNTLTSIKKTLSFDIKPSLFKDPENYTIEVHVSKYVSETSNSITDFNGLTLYDNLTNN